MHIRTYTHIHTQRIREHLMSNSKDTQILFWHTKDPDILVFFLPSDLRRPCDEVTTGSVARESGPEARISKRGLKSLKERERTPDILARMAE